MSIKIPKLILLSALVVINLYALPEKSSQAKQNKEKQETTRLVRVAFLNFIDTQGSGHYDYLSTSIPDAIKDILQSRFKYQTTGSKQNENALNKILKDSKKTAKDITKQDIRALASKQNLDIIIYGDFKARYNQKTDVSDITIRSKIYLNFFKEVIVLEPLTNPIDSTIFVVSAIFHEQVTELINLKKNYQKRYHCWR